MGTLWANFKISFLLPTGTINRCHASPTSICFNRPSFHRYPISCLPAHSLTFSKLLSSRTSHLNLTLPQLYLVKGDQAPSLLVLHTIVFLLTTVNSQDSLGTLAPTQMHLFNFNFVFTVCRFITIFNTLFILRSLKTGLMSCPMR